MEQNPHAQRYAYANKHSMLHYLNSRLNKIAARWPGKAVAQFLLSSNYKKQWKNLPHYGIVKLPHKTIQYRGLHCL